MPGIVHLGLGAFHRAHQAVMTDAALAAEFGAWGIAAVSLRSSATVHALKAQDCLYSVLTRADGETHAEVVGAIIDALAARETPERVLARMAAPETRIVTLTVTEKAYGLDAASGGLDLAHADIAADLIAPRAPRGVIGHLVEALARRRDTGVPAFTVLSCDNLSGNGHVVERLTLELARRRDPALADWISKNAAFPCSMVDRIVPAATERTLLDAERLLGCCDAAAVETEPFLQWVIEDRFVQGRPAWEAGGALFAADVASYERMKLRLLNGAHSLIAYLGQNRGIAFVREVVAVDAYRRIVEAHMRAAALTVGSVPEIDIDQYIAALLKRFANRSIDHATRQIASDGTQKLPQRLLQPAVEALESGRDGAEYARAIGEWIVYCCTAERIEDPRAAAIEAAAGQAMAGGGAPRVAGFIDIEGLFPPRLRENAAWRGRLQASVDGIWAEIAR